jgi:hypothetical protein
MKFKKGDLSREAFRIIMSDIESLELRQTESNTYHINLLKDNLKDIFDLDIQCSSCGQWLKVNSEDLLNDKCLLCNGEV